MAGCLSLVASEGLTADDTGRPSPRLSDLVFYPLLVRTLFSRPPSLAVFNDGAVTVNRQTYTWIELQRQGAEWVTRGLVTRNEEWVARGWMQLDWGIERQLPAGDFGGKDQYYSTVLFVEALARSCILSPDQARDRRLACLDKACRWLLTPSVEENGSKGFLPLLHRRYVIGSMFAQVAALPGLSSYGEHGDRFVRSGLGAQSPDGVNSEKGGFDINYQLAGCLFALRYIATNPSPALRAGVRLMLSKAIDTALQYQRPDGAFDTRTSNRMGHEVERTGEVKTVNFPEVIQTLVYGAVVNDRHDWLTRAEMIIGQPKWCRHEEGACD